MCISLIISRIRRIIVLLIRRIILRMIRSVRDISLCVCVCGDYASSSSCYVCFLCCVFL